LNQAWQKKEQNQAPVSMKKNWTLGCNRLQKNKAFASANREREKNGQMDTKKRAKCEQKDLIVGRPSERKESLTSGFNEVEENWTVADPNETYEKRICSGYSEIKRSQALAGPKKIKPVRAMK
jgi:hypothetical protein